MVTAVSEETPRLLRGDRIECRAYSFDQRLLCPGTNLAQRTLDPRESFLNRIEVRRVRWQVQQLASSTFDHLAPFHSYEPEVVHNNHFSQPHCKFVARLLAVDLPFTQEPSNFHADSLCGRDTSASTVS